MAAGGGGAGSRSMEETPTWAVAVVCLVIVVISILIEHAIHLLGKWLKKNHKRALYDALEKIKSELMLMGFISFLLTVLQSSISKICVPMSVGNSWHPCNPTEEDDIVENLEEPDENTGGGRRRLLQTAGSVRTFRRILAAGGSSDSCPEGKVALISGEAINQLHIFIFVLAVSHVLYCICTLAFGRLKMRKWKSWEMETRTAEYQFTHDPARFRFARDTSFGRRHLNFWSESPLLICKSRRLKGNQIQYGLQWPPLPEHRQRLRHLPPRAPPRAPRRLLIGSPSLPLFHFSLLLLLLPTVIPSLEPARKIWPPKRARAPEVHLLGFLHPPQPPDEEDLSPFLFGFRCRGNRAGSFDEGRVASARKAVSTRTYPGRASCAELPWHPSPLGRTTSHERKKLKPGNRGWATAQYSPCEDPSLTTISRFHPAGRLAGHRHRCTSLRPLSAADLPVHRLPPFRPSNSRVPLASGRSLLQKLHDQATRRGPIGDLSLSVSLSVLPSDPSVDHHPLRRFFERETWTILSEIYEWSLSAFIVIPKQP